MQKQLPVTNAAIQGVRGLMGPNLMTSKVSFILSDSMLWEWFHSGWQVRTCLFPLMAISRVGWGHLVTFVHSINTVCNGKCLSHPGFKGCSGDAAGPEDLGGKGSAVWKMTASTHVAGDPRVTNPKGLSFP